MDLELGYILGSGYFPFKILPPGFQTTDFTNFYIANKDKFKHIAKTSKCVPFSIPKLGYSRRVLKLPNPIHYAELCYYLVRNCKIDQNISELIIEKGMDISGMRFIDDRYFFSNNNADVLYILNELQKLLAYYDLEINNDKTGITSLPLIMSPKWKVQVQNFKFRNRSHDDEEESFARIQENDIMNFFSLIFELSEQYPQDSIIKYASKTIINLEVLDENWAVYETFLFQALLKDPYIFPEFYHLIYKKSDFINEMKLLNVIEKILLNSISKNYDFEISWCLHVCKIFELKLSEDIIKLLNSVSNSINKLLILDLIERDLVDVKMVDLGVWKKELNVQSMLSDDWLFAYEISVKGWLVDDFSYVNSVHGKNYFKIMKEKKVSFYNRDVESYDEIEFYEDYF